VWTVTFHDLRSPCFTQICFIIAANDWPV
jgi:hypothetical protein